MPDHRETPLDVPLDVADRFPGWPRVGGGSGDGPAATGNGGGAEGAGDPPDPDAGGDDGDPAEVDLAKVAEEFEARVLSEAEGGDGAEGGEGEGSRGKGAGRTPTAADSKLAKFIQENYGGDEDAFLAAQYSSRAESRRLAEENQSLRRQAPPETRDTAADLEEIYKADPDIQAFNREVQAIDNENKGFGTRAVEIVNEVRGLEAKIIEQEAGLGHIDEPKDLAKAQASLIRMRSQLDALRGEFQTNEVQRRANLYQKSNLQRDIRRAQQDIRAEMAAEENQEKTAKADGERTRKYFGAAFDALIKPFGLEPTSKRLPHIRSTVRAQLADYLDSLGDDAEGMDAASIFDATQKLIAAYADANEMKPRGTGTGASQRPKPPTPPPPRHLAVPRTPAGSGKTGDEGSGRTGPRTVDDVLSNADLVRKRATAVFTAQAKAQARGLRGRYA